MMLRRLRSFWEGLFSGAMLNFRGVIFFNPSCNCVFMWNFPSIYTTWATTKTKGYVPWNTGCLMTGSKNNGLWNNPHITVVSYFIPEKYPTNNQFGSPFFQDAHWECIYSYCNLNSQLHRTNNAQNLPTCHDASRWDGGAGPWGRGQSFANSHLCPTRSKRTNGN